MMTQYWRKYDHGTYLDAYIDMHHDLLNVAEYHRLNKLADDIKFVGNDFDESERIIYQWLNSVHAMEPCNKIARLQIQNRYKMLLAIGQCMTSAFSPAEDMP